MLLTKEVEGKGWQAERYWRCRDEPTSGLDARAAAIVMRTVGLSLPLALPILLAATHVFF